MNSSDSGEQAQVVALIGAPYSGKSTVASLLAADLGWQLYDTDEMVKERAGGSIGDVYIDGGEAHYRELESQAAQEALGGAMAVVALGSGALSNELVAPLLQRPTVVWLKVSAAQSGKRAGLHAPRPASLGNLRSQWSRMLREREVLYESLADLTIDADTLDPETIASQIVEELNLSGSAS